MAMTPSIQILLISPDLREVLVNQEAGRYKPLMLDLAAADDHFQAKLESEGPSAAVKRLTGVTVENHRWTKIPRMTDSSDPDLYMAVVDFDLEPTMTTHEGWRRVGLNSVKASAYRCDPVAVDLESTFKDLDDCDKACQALLKAFLAHVSRDVESGFPYWVRAGNDDEHDETPPFCHECCDQKVLELDHDNPEGDYQVVRGTRDDEDGIPGCVTCGKLLEVDLTSHCIDIEIEHFQEIGASFDDKWAGPTAWRILKMMKDPSHQFDAAQKVFLEMVRRGETAVPKEGFAHIPLDGEVVYAAEHHDASRVKAALDAGGSPNAIDVAAGVSAVHFACLNSDSEMLELLLSRGADIGCKVEPRKYYQGDDHSEDAGKTVIHLAVEDNDLLDVVLKHSKDVDVRNADGQTALYLICGDLAHPDDVEQAVKQLLEAGANPRAKDNLGLTPLDIADSELADLIRGFEAALAAQRAVARPATPNPRPL